MICYLGSGIRNIDLGFDTACGLRSLLGKHLQFRQSLFQFKDLLLLIKVPNLGALHSLVELLHLFCLHLVIFKQKVIFLLPGLPMTLDGLA
jgi:hypothetical protein